MGFSSYGSNGEKLAERCWLDVVCTWKEKALGKASSLTTYYTTWAEAIAWFRGHPQVGLGEGWGEVVGLGLEQLRLLARKAVEEVKDYRDKRRSFMRSVYCASWRHDGL